MNAAAGLVIALCTHAAYGQPGSPPEDASPQFRACYAESKGPWLADILTPPSASSEEIEQAVGALVPQSPEQRGRAKSYVIARRAGKYATSQVMAASVFADCMAREVGSTVEMNHAVACFREQRLIFVAMDMRFNAKLSQEAAMEAYLSKNEAQPAAAKNSAIRVIRDTYTVLQQGQESAFAEAQFQLCMNGR
jgi:hypothetical protein